MEFLFQLLAELLLQLLVEGSVDLLTGRFKLERPLLRFFVFTGLGVVSGLASLLFARHHMIEERSLRYIAALIVPVLIGLLMWRIGKFKLLRGKEPYGLEYFFSSWAFAFTFGVMRVAYAK